MVFRLVADFLPGQQYVGVDANAEMVAAGRARGREIVEADLNAYVPAASVEATTQRRTSARPTSCSATLIVG